MMRVLQNLFQLDDPDSVGTKIQLRAFEFFAVIYTLIYTWEWAFYIPRLSDVVLPLGLANYLDISIFFSNDISIYNAVLISLFTLVPLLLKRVRWLYAIAFVLFHLQHVARFSQGEIPHSANLVAFSLMGLGLAALFFKGMKKELSFAFGFTLFFFGLGYTSAAISKLVATGVTWVDGYHLWLWMGEKSIDILSLQGEFQYNWLQELAFNSRFLATLILSFGLITELLGFTIWFKKLRPYIVIMLIGMHVGIDLTMNIFFKTFTIQLIIMGFFWNRYINVIPGIEALNEHPLVKKILLY
ncbi:hypothetical protein [Gracilimonas amylolytica]|uniref:hypothetical protein n=1 Tax=Gracilimonas amylolytica TaxID=1749045 RepID=UPI000CD9E72A|nr:hypothetical protein [Gracilimonas amylolytica]